MTDKNVTLRVRQVGDKDLRKIVRGLDSVRKQTKSIGTNLTQLRGVFFSVFGGFGVRELFRAADSIQLLSDRVKVFTGDAVEAERALNGLFESADATNTSVGSLAETFNRVALATKELGLNTEELIGFTATLQNTFRLSGATTAEAGAAAIQLSQGLASGQLRGQELRSVLEQNAVIGDILAKTLNTTRGQLIKFAEQGTITSQVVLSGLAERAIELNEEAQKLGRTFGQSLTVAFNSVQKRLNEFNQRFELSRSFASGIDFLIERIDKLAIAFGVVLVPAIIAGLRAIGLALAANPVTLIAASLSTLIVFSDEIVKSLELASLSVLKFFVNIDRSVKQFIVDSGSSDNIILKKIFGSENQVKIAQDSLNQTANSISDIDKKIADINTEASKSSNFANFLSAFEKLASRDLNVAGANAASASDAIAKLNKQLELGTISVNDYVKSIRELEEQSLEKQFNQGALSATEYAKRLRELKDINENFTDNIFGSLQLGAVSYLETVGTVTSQLTGLFDRTFQGLEDTIFDTLKSGKLAFADFAQAILDDLTRVLIRTQIVAPIAQSVGSFSAGFFDSRETFTPSALDGRFAKGGVFQGGNQKAFASGGIVNGPTMFPMNSGSGIMGESGPEAIVPLQRTSDGDLGIKANPSNVVVNVNNNAGVDVDVQSNDINGTNVLDVTITRAVQGAIGSGKLDRALSANFGINRKGSR